jgi:endoglucanase
VGSGPVITRGPHIHPGLADLLVKTADSLGIQVQFEASGEATNTDADSIFISRAGVPTCLVSIATRYLHTGSELTSLQDVAQTVALVNETVSALSSQGVEALAFSV